MIQITVICERIDHPIDLTWDRKQGRALSVLSENSTNLVTSRKINTRLALSEVKDLSLDKVESRSCVLIKSASRS